MAVSKFKAKCLAALRRIQRTGQPVRITRFGKPVADVIPSPPEAVQPEWLGSLRGTLEIEGDLVAPTSELVAWEVRE